MHSSELENETHHAHLTRGDSDDKAIELYLPAGVASSPLFMEGVRQSLHRALAGDVASVRSALLFPYGDRQRSLLVQLREVGRDLRWRADRQGGSIGGSRLLSAIDDKRRSLGCDIGTRTVLVGHSAGGVAAVHAASLLHAREGGMPPLVVMIGSPRCRIPEALRDSVLYVYAAKGAAARLTDPITRFGTFGGWQAGRWRLPRWRMDKHAPVHACGLRMIGGHADYFRDQPPFVNGLGLSNLTLTVDVVLRWLRERL